MEEWRVIPVNKTKECEHDGKCIRLELPLRRKGRARTNVHDRQRGEIPGFSYAQPDEHLGRVQGIDA